MSLAIILSVLCVLSHHLIEEVESVVCLSCTHIVQPSDCSQIRECGSNEQCYMKRYVTTSGNTWYDVGCLDNSKCAAFSGPLPGGNQITLPPSIIGRRGDLNATSYKRFTNPPSVIGRREDTGDTVTCEHCCNGAICNKGGYCGAKPLDNPGPVCYSCKDAQQADGCDQIEQCGANEYCYIKQELNKVSQEFRWKHGCQSTTQCIHVQGTRSVDQDTDVYFFDDNTKPGNEICDDCCTKDLCNNKCTYFVDWNAPVTTPSGGNTPPSSGDNSTVVTTTIPTTTVTTLPTTTLDPFITVDCDFESDFCNWHQDKMDDGNWRLHQGATATERTGPMFDHTRNDEQGHYIYLEASDLYYQNYVRLVSDYIGLPDNTCLQFWYHMHGNYIGALNIIIKDKDDNETKIWSKEGNQGDQWVKASVPINNVPRGNLIIEGFRGADIYGDISIDDIKLVSGCST